MATPERVAIAAAGVVTPIGADLESFWSALITGASGISQIERFPVADLRVQRGGEVKKLGRIKDWCGVPDCRATRLLDRGRRRPVSRRPRSARSRSIPRASRWWWAPRSAASRRARRRSRATGRRRRFPDALYDGPGLRLARWLGAPRAGDHGVHRVRLRARPRWRPAPICSAATRPTRWWRAATTPSVASCCAASTRSARSPATTCAPSTEGAAACSWARRRALVLLVRERDLRGPRLGTVLGYGSASDGFHIAAPEPDGRGLERAIRAALADAGVSPRDVDFVSAHGTATLLNDRIETAALKRALGAARARGAGELDQGRPRAHHGRRRRARGLHVPARRPSAASFRPRSTWRSPIRSATSTTCRAWRARRGPGSC